MAIRSTYGIVDRIEPNGFGTIHEIDSNRSGFFSNATVENGSFKGVRVKSRVAVDVDDSGELLVVKSIKLA